MAVCPKCGEKLRLYHWRPECPACGVNMIYYNANERLLAETEQAEIEHARSQPGIDRAKASFFGSAPAIARLVLSVLPLGALFLPLGRTAGGQKIAALQLVDKIQELGADGILGGVKTGDPSAVSLLLLLLSAVLILVCIICLPMSLGKHGKARNLILNVCLLGCAVGSAIAFAVGGGTLLVGAFVYIGLLAAILIYNLILAKKGLRVKWTTCLIGGLPSDEYFAMVESGCSELEIRKKMVDALTVMQEEVRAKAAEEEAAEKAKRAAWK